METEMFSNLETLEPVFPIVPFSGYAKVVLVQRDTI